jgi:hypothetical protein
MPRMRGMVHLNSNMLASVWIETSGPEPYHHEIIEICIMPLQKDIKQDKDFLPFYCNIRPSKISNITDELQRKKKKKIVDALNHGIDPFKAMDLFEQWFEKLNLPEGKNIQPLSYDWASKLPFIMDWLTGPKNYYHYFSTFYRDILANANYLNDYCYFHILNQPFPKQDFMYLASQLKVDADRSRDSINYCVYLAQMHREMLRDSMVKLPIVEEQMVEVDSEDEIYATEE